MPAASASSPARPEEAALRAWIDRLAQLKGDELAKALRYREEEAAGTGAVRPQVALRRLTHSQYNNTVRDLLGDRSLPANQFPPEDFVNGFKNQYMAQNLSPLLEDAYSAAAEKLAAHRVPPGNAHNLVTCQPSPACRAAVHPELRPEGLPPSARLPRRRSRYEALFQKQADFATGAQLVVEAMLQSPNFLFRLEDTANPKWRPYAAASRLSYALWDSMPDDALLAAAARGELDTPDGVEKVARRMLDDPKARQALDEFVVAVAPLRPRPDRHQGAPRVPAVHSGYGHRDDPGSAPLRLRPGLERPQFHRALHRAVRLHERRPRAHLRRRAAGQRFRPRRRSPPTPNARDCSGRRCS